MTTWHLGRGVTVRPLTKDDARAMHRLIVDNREHLDRWLRWSSSIQTQADVTALIAAFQEKLQQRDGMHSGIWAGTQLAGGVVCWYINRANRNAEVGYWLGKHYTGRGWATRATRAMVAYLFKAENVQRVEMQCGVTNAKSRAIPERLGFRLEGIRRESHWITDRFVDHAVYGILAHEWTFEEAVEDAR